MWVGKRLFELMSGYVAEKAVNAELRVQLAQERARADQFIALCNELRLERAELYARIGVNVPVPTLSRESTPPLPGLDDGYAPPLPHQRVPNFDEAINVARDTLAEQMRKTRVPEPPRDLAGISFEDMGDDDASAAGILREADGTLVTR